MEISRLFTKNENTPPLEYFLAVQIQEGVVQTAVWLIDEGQATVVALGDQVNWEDAEDLVEAVDKSLAVACNGLESEPSRVIFGLPEYWLESNKISSEYGSKVKAILAKLELKPLGFVTTTEAVLQYLKTSEGIPPSVVVVELGRTRIGVVVTRLGEVLGREEVGRSADLATDVEEGLARIDVGQLPSRILVIDGVDPEAQQQLASYSWQEKLPFLHLPKVESLGPEFSVRAVALAGGAEAAKAIGIPLAEESAVTEEIEPANTNEPTVESETDGEKAVVNITEPEADLGFVINRDIRNVSANPQLGEVITKAELPHSPRVNKFSGFFSDVKGKLSNRREIKVPTVKFRLSLPKVTLVVIGLLILLGGAAWATYSRSSRAVITVEVGGQSLTKTVDLAVGDAKDSGLPTAPAETETVSLEKSGSLSTTGEAVIGERAIGEVTIFNKTDTSRTLKAGTVLTTTNILRFTLDEAVEVASRTAEEKEGGLNITFGQKNINATASKIGAELNIAANTSLSVDDYPKNSLEAKVGKEFTGGSSRTVKAVSKADRDKLQDQLADQIEQDAVAAQDQRTQGSTKAIPVGEPKITETAFSKGVDEEADELSLDLKGEVTLLKFSTDNLKNLVITQLAPDIPSGFEIDPGKTIVNIENVAENSDGVMIAKVNIEAQLTPKLDIEGYKDKLRGQPVLAAKILFENLANYRDIHIEVTPNFPILSQRLPSSPDQIEIQIQAQR
ncbi:MAG: hypothetical protein UY08_C0015G0007 [Candidatus Gottesmanbacteria bacterium GW2011_GWA1_47_8]|uniref:Baseplate protein J-like domain-containing protein n=1 Tax=Candidatus Gottesmanbacteria bacterium GW2011_GWA1_47_8 TaxID=1618438 RepID=A0A0G1WEH4_9BACT|nr:MAG: hypothetical protein UY08_C0015G0007 [Candidatus Gottesmanbacteria bacterium GW2011_GWA1_47_8]